MIKSVTARPHALRPVTDIVVEIRYGTGSACAGINMSKVDMKQDLNALIDGFIQILQAYENNS